MARIHPPYDYVDFDGANFEYPYPTAVPTPPRPRPIDFRLNVLTFPTAASRPAWFHFVCETSRLEAIQTAVGSTATLAPLVMFDGRTSKTITVQMTIVGARPFNVTVGDDNETFWLVTLSDIRYLWYMKRGTVTAPSSWSDLFSQIGTLLGVTVTTDTINADYGDPSEKWATAYNNPTALLDAAAYQVGQRSVVGTDGSVSTLNWETAKSTSDAYLSNNTHILSGGVVSSESLVRAAPASCVTVFSDISSGSSSLIPFAVTNTLVSLSIPEYGAATGLSGYHDTVFADTAYDGGNTAACNAYAAAAAEDNYGWRLTDPDVSYPGIEPWEPTGWEERVEWMMTVTGDGPFARTTIRRGPWKEFHRDGLFPTPGVTQGLTVEEVDGDPSVTNVSILQFDQDDGFVVSEPVPGTARVNLTPRLTVKEVDEDPTVTEVVEIQFDQADGFIVSEVDPGIARVDFAPKFTYISNVSLYASGGYLIFDYTQVVDGVPIDHQEIINPCELVCCDENDCTEPGEQVYLVGEYTFTAECTGPHTVECWGPGGDGHELTDTDGRAGGGGGAYSRSVVCLEEGVEYAVVVQGGGTELPTTFAVDTAVQVVAGAGGNAAIAGNIPGEGGGSDSIGQFQLSGGTGGVAFGPPGGGGGGGSGAGPVHLGINGTDGTILLGGVGGEGGSEMGAGAGGDGGDIGFGGDAGTDPGGGGGGASSTPATTGGAGANGKVRIRWGQV